MAKERKNIKKCEPMDTIKIDDTKYLFIQFMNMEERKVAVLDNFEDGSRIYLDVE